MLRFLRYGTRNYGERPDLVASRTGWEFFAILEGQAGPVFDKNTRIEHFSSSLWLLRPGISYNWHTPDEEITRATFHFSSIPDLLRTQVDSKNFLRIDLDEKGKELIDDVANMLMPHYLNPTELLDLYSDKAIIEFSLLFLNNAVINGRPDPYKQRESKRAHKAKEWYQKNLKCRPTIDHVAMEVGVSSTQLRRDFHLVYGTTPQVVFRRLRLYEGARLLANTDWTIERIYPEAGFASREDFSRAFKEEYKASPHEWRRNTALGWK